MNATGWSRPPSPRIELLKGSDMSRQGPVPPSVQRAPLQQELGAPRQPPPQEPQISSHHHVTDGGSVGLCACCPGMTNPQAESDHARLHNEEFVSRQFQQIDASLLGHFKSLSEEISALRRSMDHNIQDVRIKMDEFHRSQLDHLGESCKGFDRALRDNLRDQLAKKTNEHNLAKVLRQQYWHYQHFWYRHPIEDRQLTEVFSAWARLRKNVRTRPKPQSETILEDDSWSSRQPQEAFKPLSRTGVREETLHDQISMPHKSKVESTTAVLSKEGDQLHWTKCEDFIELPPNDESHGVKDKSVELDTEFRELKRGNCKFLSDVIPEWLDRGEDVGMTLVSSDLFESPMPALGRSGGTAAFFKATLKADPPPSKNYWIAKDLSRARDELAFYELAKRHEDKEGFELLKWMTEYMGVCTIPCQVKEEGDPEDVQVLLIRNGRDGYKTCRMLDIKIGYATAVAGWQGKSSFAATKQGLVDSFTNSGVEGFRLEGFDNPPPVLRSFEQINFTQKQLKRFNLQCMSAYEFLKFFLDVHDVRESAFGKKSPECPYTPFDKDDALTEVELQELILLNIIEDLAGFVAACRKCPCPQQWIGSSVMLAFDSDARPSREETLGAIAGKRGLTRVHVFDWGRSELNTPGRDRALSDKDAEDRKKYWGQYCGGLANLLFDCCAIYVGRYWHETARLVYTVWDKNQYSDDAFIGKCILDLAEKKETARELSDWAGDVIEAGLLMMKSASKLVVSTSAVDLPESSRLRKGISTRVHRCENLPNMDAVIVDHTDAFVEISGMPQYIMDVNIRAKKAMRDIAHSTSLCMDTEWPVFEEEFKFATLHEESKADLLKALGLALGMDGSMKEVEMLQLFTNHTTDFEKDGQEAACEFAQRCFPGLNCVQ